MLIFELPPSHADGAGKRVVSLGSCRVRNPIQVLADRGDVLICDAGLSATHSAAETLQAIRFVRGETRIPDAFAPYVFETEKTPPMERLALTLTGGVDVVLLEISDDRQFSCGNILFQQNFISRNLVQAHRGALLAWYREICRGRAVDEDCVQSALNNLRDGGFRHDEEMAGLLRGMRLKRAVADDIAQTIREMMTKLGGRWMVVGAITIPGHDGAIMHDRRALNETVKTVAMKCGAGFYDPTALIIDYGRETVLDSQGANINEYAKSFSPILGETLVSLARTGRPAPKRDSALAAGATAKTPASTLADRLNMELIDLHRRRLDEFGLEKSGLYAYYKARLDQGCMIAHRERFAFNLIDTYLPPYEAYAVMRAGLGELALLLAASGRQVIAYEPTASRRVAIEAGAAHLQRAGLLAPGRLTTVGALTPAEPLGGRVMGVGLDVAHVRTEAAAAPHLENARAFEALLIDLRCFITLHEAFADQMALAQTLRSMGFDERRDYPHEGLFWFHRSRQTINRPAGASGAPPALERPRTDAAA